jgi:hypothetical protein
MKNIPIEQRAQNLANAWNCDVYVYPRLNGHSFGMTDSFMCMTNEEQKKCKTIKPNGWLAENHYAGLVIMHDEDSDGNPRLTTLSSHPHHPLDEIIESLEAYEQNKSEWLGKGVSLELRIYPRRPENWLILLNLGYE